MANGHEGEATVKLSDGTTLTLRRDLRAFGRAETAAGVSMQVIKDTLAKGGPSIDFTVALIWGALQHHHPEYDLDACYSLLEHNAEAISEAMASAGVSASPQRGAPSANPPVPSATSPASKRSSRRGAKKD